MSSCWGGCVFFLLRRMQRVPVALYRVLFFSLLVFVLVMSLIPGEADPSGFMNDKGQARAGVFCAGVCHGDFGLSIGGLGLSQASAVNDVRRVDRGVAGAEWVSGFFPGGYAG